MHLEIKYLGNASAGPYLAENGKCRVAVVGQTEFSTEEFRKRLRAMSDDN